MQNKFEKSDILAEEVDLQPLVRCLGGDLTLVIADAISNQHSRYLAARPNGTARVIDQPKSAGSSNSEGRRRDGHQTRGDKRSR